MGGDCSQKLLPQRGLSFLSGASSTSGSCKINTLAQALPDVAWSDYPEERLSKVGVARRRTQLPTAWVNFGKQRWATSRERRRANAHETLIRMELSARSAGPAIGIVGW